MHRTAVARSQLRICRYTPSPLPLLRSGHLLHESCEIYWIECNIKYQIFPNFIFFNYYWFCSQFSSDFLGIFLASQKMRNVLNWYFCILEFFFCAILSFEMWLIFISRYVMHSGKLKEKMFKNKLYKTK